MSKTGEIFSKKCLIANWYEERLANVQPYKADLQYRSIREKEDAISYPALQGKLLQLPTIKRAHPWDTKDTVIVDDKFREYRSVSKTSYDIQNLNNYYKLDNCKPLMKHSGNEMPYPEANPYSLHTQHQKQPNYHTLLKLRNNNEDFSITKDVNAFKQSFKEQKAKETIFRGETTYQSGFKINDLHKSQQQEIQEKFSRAQDHCGVEDRPYEQQGIKATSVLTGEKYKTEQDPKDNSFVQRTWLYHPDECLRVAKRNLDKNELINSTLGVHPSSSIQTYKNNLNQNFNYDIATSLPLCGGTYNLHKKAHTPGEFRRIRQDVTIINNVSCTKR